MVTRRLCLLAPLLVLAGCARGCGLPALSAPPPLTIAATTTASIVVTRPGAPWRATFVAADSTAGAPTLVPDPTFSDHLACRWQTADGTHHLRLSADELALSYHGERATDSLFWTERSKGGVYLLPFGEAIAFGGDPPPLVSTRWHGELGAGTLEVVTWGAGDGHAYVVLRDGAPLDSTALGGSLRQSSSGGGVLRRLEVTSPALSFVLEWPDWAAPEITAPVQLDGRTVQVTFQRLAPGQRPSSRG